jgi:hypothetical protein
MNTKYPVAHIELLDTTSEQRTDFISALAEFQPKEQSDGTIVLLAGLSQSELQQRLDQHLSSPARARILMQRNFGESAPRPQQL